jgi:hypothetical protein
MGQEPGGLVAALEHAPDLAGSASYHGDDPLRSSEQPIVKQIIVLWHQLLRTHPFHSR